MDEVSHHALKGGWCNWDGNGRRRSLDARARQIHTWGGAQAYEEDEKGCGMAQGLVTSAVTWLAGGGVTCSVGRGRGRVPDGPTLLLSSSRARVRRSNCISCSRTDARRDAAFSHCSIHTEREDKALHTHTHSCIHRERVQGTDSLVRSSTQHTHLNQKKKWKQSHRTLQSDPTCTQLANRHRVTA